MYNTSGKMEKGYGLTLIKGADTNGLNTHEILRPYLWKKGDLQ